MQVELRGILRVEFLGGGFFASFDCEIVPVVDFDGFADLTGGTIRIFDAVRFLASIRRVLTSHLRSLTIPRTRASWNLLAVWGMYRAQRQNFRSTQAIKNHSSGR